MDKMEAIPKVFMRDPVFRRLEEVARVAVLNQDERSDYERSLKIYRDNYAIALTERNEGYAEGEAKGFAEGEAKGRAEGEAKGEAKAIRIMHEMGIPVDVIAEKYGIAPAKVLSILERYNSKN